MSFSNPDKSKWQPEHYRTHKLVQSLVQVIETKETELEKIQRGYDIQIAQINKNIKALQNNCKHIDDGGPFVASCSICGWTDYYGG